MGGNLSHHVLTRHKKFLSVLCGTTSLHIGDPFWSQFGQFPTQLPSLDPKEVQKTLEPYCRQLVVNSRITRNFQTLLLRVIGVVSNCQNSDQQLTAINGICFLKFVFKSLLEKLPGSEFISFIDQQTFLHHQSQDGLLVKLVRSLVDVIVEGDVSGYGYLLVVEALSCLLVGCSSQLYVEMVTWSEGTHPVLEILMNEHERAGMVIQNLMNWYIQRLAPPYSVKIFQKQPEEAPSVFRFVRRAAVSVLWFPVTAFKYLVGSASGQEFSPLADAAQHFFLILIHHVPYKSVSRNPYREALRALQDVAYMGGVETRDKQQDFYVPTICFSDLYEVLSKALDDERGTLMLYTMLQCIQSFRDYTTVRSDLQTITIPLLKQTYQVSFSSQSQLYLLSIILLILTQDTSFCQEVHKIYINDPEWFKERPFGKMTLGSLMIVLLLKTASKNLSTSRDLYLHTNTMAALANIACMAHGLDSLPAQRFLALIERLTKKLQKLIVENEEQIEKENVEFTSQFYRDFLTLMLEVLNGMISLKPANNPHLIYSVLQRQHLFNELYKISPDFRDLTENIQILTEYFNSKIDEVKRRNTEGVATVERVLEVVKSASKMWTTENLRQIPDLRFSYEEEDSAEQFFVPVVWTLIVSFSGIPWNTDSIALFSPQTPTTSAVDSEGTTTLQEVLSTNSNGIPEVV